MSATFEEALVHALRELVERFHSSERASELMVVVSLGRSSNRCTSFEFVSPSLRPSPSLMPFTKGGGAPLCHVTGPHVQDDPVTSPV